MTKCEHWDAGWCYAPVDVKTNAIGKFGVCKLPECCPYLKSQNKMTDMFISIDGEATLGTKCPTHKLEIKKMNEIQQTEGEIKVLQAKLELLKEMEKHMSPCKIAYRDWWGEYPTTTWRCDIDRWNAFEAGYNASKEEYKVEEEPKPKPETLYNVMRHGLECSIDMCDGVVNAVEKWLPDEVKYDGEKYHLGWNDAIRTTKDKLR